MYNDVHQKIISAAEALEEKLVAQRRDFHKYAETGWLEMRTSSIIARKLTEMGYPVLTGRDVCLDEARMGLPEAEVLEANYRRAVAQGADPEFVRHTKDGFTGVIATLDCGEGPTLALRFDIDALGVFESDDADHRPAAGGYRSVNEGMMHACGHDGHATIGLGVAEVLMGIRDRLHGQVKLIFQPAEEGVRGAKSIVAAGHLDDVDYCIGSHIFGRGDLPADFIGGSGGYLATTKMDVTFHGKSSHASDSPHMGKNAMLAACTTVMNLYAIPRHGQGPTRLNVGRLTAGSGRNVVCDTARLEMEVRGSTSEVNDYMETYAKRIIEGAALMHDCTYEIKFMGASASLDSSPELIARTEKIGTQVLGLRAQPYVRKEGGGSEDFAYMNNRVQEHGGQSTFIQNLTDCSAPLHNRKFDFNDREALVNGVKLFCALVYDIMK